MGFYSSPEEMFAARADKYKRDGDRHWAMAKNGEGGYNYGKARACYEQSAENRAKADQAKATGTTFAKRK